MIKVREFEEATTLQSVIFALNKSTKVGLGLGLGLELGLGLGLGLGHFPCLAPASITNDLLATI